MAITFFEKDKLTALQAKESAQWIAFGPTVFQAARVLRDSGVLKAVEDSRRKGTGLEAIAEKTDLPVYGVRVLLEAGLSIGLVTVKEGLYRITKTGFFILHDELTRVNMDFQHDICYKAMFTLGESIETGKPVGLKEFGNWNTVYEGLSQLPPQAQKSWFNFDHFFSDDVFRDVLPMVYRDGVKKLLDIGGNTGKWAMVSTQYRDEIRVTIVDLPGQLEMARKNIEAKGLSDRVSFHPANILDQSFKVPEGFDAIWMSQFLDCFGESQIVSILERCYQALGPEGRLFIMEPFWDRQKFEAAAFCLQQTSLYFTTVANGNSQMYSAEVFLRCIEKAGFEIVEETNHIGLSQTLLKCRKRS